MKTTLTVILMAALIVGTGCNEKQLKKPASAGGEKPSQPATMKEPDVRQMARVFAQEFAAELKRQNVTLAAAGGSGQANPAAPVAPVGRAVTLDSAPDVMDFYEASPDGFTVAKPGDLPADLKWVKGAELAEFSSSEAKRGGTFHEYTSDFPRTLRFVGPDGNGAFRSYMLDYNALYLVMAHPNGDGYYPGLAKEWAYGPDGRTVYFRLHSDARYSDGEPLRVTDFFFSLYMMRSKHIQAPWYNDFFSTEKFENVTIYDEHTLSIRYFKAKPDVIEKIAGLRPIPEHFYTELDEQYVEDFQFKFEPTLGAYEVKLENVKQGESVTLTRVPGWWADKKKFFRNRFNPDAIKVTVVRDPGRAFELFRKGDLDWHGLSLPEYWYEKLSNDDELVKNGHVQKIQFYNDIPRPTWAIRLNSSHPVLSNRDIRIGMNYAINFSAVIEKCFRNDYERMHTVADGYGPRSHPTLKARAFSVKLAKEHFAKAGYTQVGPDGVLRTPAGKRLSFVFTTPYKRLDEAGVMTVIKEEAKKAGVELQVEVMERTAAWKKISEKKHEIMLGALNTSVEMYPRFWEPYHSDNAYKEDKADRYDADGKLKPGLTPKPVTNNFALMADQEIDGLIDKFRVCEDLDEITRLSHTLIQKIHDHGAYIPGWVRPWYRVGQWRWVKYPEDYNVRESREPFEYHIHWIDSDEKARTLKAMEDGKASGTATIRTFAKHKLD